MGVGECQAHPLPNSNAVTGEAGDVLGVYEAIGLCDEVADAVEQPQPLPRCGAQERWNVNSALVPEELRCVVESLEDVTLAGDHGVAASHLVQERLLEEGLQDGDNRPEGARGRPLY